MCCTVPLADTVLLLPGKGIGYGREFARSVFEAEGEVGEEVAPADLSAVEFLGRPKALEVLVVGEDENFVRALKPVAPVLEGLDDREELLVVYVVVGFGVLELTAGEADGEGTV